MREIEARALTEEAFAPYGVFADLIGPSDENKIGEPPIEFYPDLVSLTLDTTNPAFSSLFIRRRPMVIDVTERHHNTGEGILPLNGPVVIHVGPPGDTPPLDQIEAFLVPAGTQVVLRPGIWHHAPFTVGNHPVAIQIALPPETYRRDCEAVILGSDQQISIVMAML